MITDPHGNHIAFAASLTRFRQMSRLRFPSEDLHRWCVIRTLDLIVVMILTVTI